MKLREVQGVTIEDLELALLNVNQLFGNNIAFDTLNEIEPGRWSVTLKAIRLDGQGCKFTRPEMYGQARPTNVACFHVQEAFFQELPKDDINGNDVKVRVGNNWLSCIDARFPTWKEGHIGGDKIAVNLLCECEHDRIALQPKYKKNLIANQNVCFIENSNDKIIMNAPPQLTERIIMFNTQPVTETKENGQGTGKRRFDKRTIFEIFQRVDNKENTITAFAKEYGFGPSTYSHWRSVLSDEYEQWKLDGTIIEGKANGHKNNGRKQTAKQLPVRVQTPADQIRQLKARKDELMKEFTAKIQSINDQIIAIVDQME